MKDLSQLPKAAATPGHPPDIQPWFCEQLAEAWALGVGDDHKDMAFPEARVRHSWAGWCARKIAYSMTDTPGTPLSPSSAWVMGLGTLVHDRWQEVMLKVFPDGEIEKKVWIEDCKSAGHIDLFIPETIHGRVAVELKTIGGYGFKVAVGAKGQAQGPRSTAYLQGALNGLAEDCDRIVVVNLATENIAEWAAQKLGPEDWRRYSAEWSYDRAAYEPDARREVQRMADITRLVDDERQVPRCVPIEMPTGARITNPKTGAWVLKENGAVTQAGSYWGCNYCAFQGVCEDDLRA